MSTKNQRRSSREGFWRTMVGRWQGSGLSVRAFCQQHGLSQPSFYSWRRTFAVPDAATVHFAPVRVVPDPTPETAADAGSAGWNLSWVQATDCGSAWASMGRPCSGSWRCWRRAGHDGELA